MARSYRLTNSLVRSFVEVSDYSISEAFWQRARLEPVPAELCLSTALCLALTA